MWAAEGPVMGQGDTETSAQRKVQVTAERQNKSGRIFMTRVREEHLSLERNPENYKGKIDKLNYNKVKNC